MNTLGYLGVLPNANLGDYANTDSFRGNYFCNVNLNQMKALATLLITTTIILSSVQTNAYLLKGGDDLMPISILADARIETIDEHSFFILNLENRDVNINHGDKVELFFGMNNIITVFNISNENNNAFSNQSELVVFISPEDLRCFKKKKLKKVIIHSDDEPMVIKTNIGRDQIEIK